MIKPYTGCEFQRHLRPACGSKFREIACSNKVVSLRRLLAPVSFSRLARSFECLSLTLTVVTWRNNHLDVLGHVVIALYWLFYHFTVDKTGNLGRRPNESI